MFCLQLVSAAAAVLCVLVNMISDHILEITFISQILMDIKKILYT